MLLLLLLLLEAFFNRENLQPNEKFNSNKREFITSILKQDPIKTNRAQGSRLETTTTTTTAVKYNLENHFLFKGSK